MGVSKNSGTPKWMVYMENPINMDDLGVYTIIFGNSHIQISKKSPTGPTEQTPKKPEYLIAIAIYLVRGPLG